MSDRQWSPAQISGRLKTIGINLSHELIYQHVWADKRRGGKLYLNLRNRGKKYTPRSQRCAGRGMIPNRVGIEHRPKIVDEKVRVGDLELDTIMGARHRGAIVSIVDRRTKLRGIIITNGEYKILPTYHPAYILRNRKRLETFTQDIERAVACSQQERSSHLFSF